MANIYGVAESTEMYPPSWGLASSSLGQSVQKPCWFDQIMTSSDIDPPEDIPEEVSNALKGSSDSQLREIIHYAQQLLREHPPLTDAIDSREGEELVRVEDHGAYTIVVVERPDQTGEGRGPFAYRVRWEPGIGGGEGKYRWHYLGKVYGESGGE